MLIAWAVALGKLLAVHHPDVRVVQLVETRTSATDVCNVDDVIEVVDIGSLEQHDDPKERQTATFH